MPSNGRLPPRRRARRVAYQFIADILRLVVDGNIRLGDLNELARSAQLYKHPKAARFARERDEDMSEWPADVDELKAAMRDIEREMRAAVHGRAGRSRTKGPAGAGGRR